MSLQVIKDVLKDYAKDQRLNIESILSSEGAPGLSEEQIIGIFLASAYATKVPAVIEFAEGIAREKISSLEIEGVKAATTVMGMNNVYYRFLHLLEGHDDIKKMPAKLRMNILAKPGIEKVNFELYSLAVSAINACGMCITAHVHEIEKAGVSAEGIQSTVRIASVTNAVAQAIVIG